MSDCIRCTGKKKGGGECMGELVKQLCNVFVKAEPRCKVLQEG